jgi:hypothetical protein
MTLSLTCFTRVLKVKKGCFMFFVCGTFIVHLFLMRTFNELLRKMHKYHYHVTIAVFDIKGSKKTGEFQNLNFLAHLAERPCELLPS